MNPAEQIWRAVPIFAAGFLFGALLCSLPTSSASRSDDLDIKVLQIDVAHLQEKLELLEKQHDTILAWVNATDRQRVQDAEEQGSIKTTVAAHEWGVRVIVGACAVNAVGLIFLFMKKRETYDGQHERSET